MLSGMAGLTQRDGVNNKSHGIKTGIVRKLEGTVDSRVLKWFGQIKWIILI